jgi:hypothetical protein
VVVYTFNMLLFIVVNNIGLASVDTIGNLRWCESMYHAILAWCISVICILEAKYCNSLESSTSNALIFACMSQLILPIN